MAIDWIVIGEDDGTLTEAANLETGVLISRTNRNSSAIGLTFVPGLRVDVLEIGGGEYYTVLRKIHEKKKVADGRGRSPAKLD